MIGAVNVMLGSHAGHPRLHAFVSLHVHSTLRVADRFPCSLSIFHVYPAPTHRRSLSPLCPCLSISPISLPSQGLFNKFAKQDLTKQAVQATTNRDWLKARDVFEEATAKLDGEEAWEGEPPSKLEVGGKLMCFLSQLRLCSLALPCAISCSSLCSADRASVGLCAQCSFPFACMCVCDV